MNQASPADQLRKILLVDDDPIGRKLLGVCLAEAGYQVSVASSAHEALDAVRREVPDVLVSDVILGDLDGFALCRSIREDPGLQSLPLVLVSAHFHEAEDRRLARAVGASALAERTPDCQAELAAIEEALGGKKVPGSRVNPAEVPRLYAERLAGQMAHLLGKAHDAEARYRALFENAKDAISVTTPEGIVIEANDAWERILQRPREGIVGHHIRDFCPPEQAEANLETYRRNATHTDGAATVPLLRSDGEIRQVQISTTAVETGGQTMMLNIGRDVTDSLESGRKLEASELKYRTLIESIPDIVWTARSDGTLSFVSNNVERICGVGVAEALETSLGFWLGRVHPEDLAAVRAGLRKLREGTDPVDIESRWQRPDGKWVSLLARARASVRDGKRVVDGLVSDVTERRTLEEQMRQAQKMEAIGQLTGGVAHDFNNILAAILINAQLLAADLGEQDPRREEAAEIEIATERAITLTRQLLAFSRRQILAPAKLSLPGVVDGLEKMLRRLIGEDIDFSVIHAAEPATVLADPGQVEQVILNLAVNARDAMPQGGKLTIETSNVDLDEEYALGHLPVVPGPYVMLAVSDTGCGMDEETKKHIFEPFFTTKEKGRGTGLGLSTCYGIVKQSQGYIWVYSEPGLGTTFRIYFPRVDGAGEAASPKRPIGELQGRETVLVIEDEEPVRIAVQRVLERFGYRVLVSADAEQAASIVRSHGQAIDVILSDVVVPGSNGPSLVRELTGSPSRAKVVFMSGYTDHAVLRNGALQKGTNFIQKPFAPHALVAKIREALDSPGEAGASQ